jgi:hypothetical protein
LDAHGWYRIDARGNKDGVRTAFTPPSESLACCISNGGEADLPEIWPSPLPTVVDALSSARTVDELRYNLPDISVIKSQNSIHE